MTITLSLCASLMPKDSKFFSAKKLFFSHLFIKIKAKRKSAREVSANVDFYSGFVYRMLGLPAELYTPIFAIARISGWSAHRLEELVSGGKIIRPAYANVAKPIPYIPIKDRTKKSEKKKKEVKKEEK